MDLIRLEGVSFAYRDRPPVFEDLDFGLAEGQRIGITGPNGAGKSTLFGLAMGLLTPQAGRVFGLGSQRKREADFREVRLSIGYCFQDPDDQLFSPTVAEDVAFGPLNQGLRHGQVHEIVEKTLYELGLEGFGERVTYHLSGGEKRLVSLATVLAMRPRALLLDEPSAGLDPATCERLVEVLRASGLSWAVISHDNHFLERTCDQRLTLADGRLRG